MIQVLLLLLFLLGISADAQLNSGAYVHHPEDGKYYPDNSGQYIPDDSGRYNPDGSGRYSGDKSGDYRDTIAKYKGGNFGNKNFIGQASNNAAIVRQIRKPAVPVRVPRVVPSNTYNANKEGKWKILKQVNEINPEGLYHWEYQTENKINAEEKGQLVNQGTDNEVLRAKGFYEYTGPDNILYKITYTADENGFVAEGAHLPTPPPIPDAILKGLKYQ